MAEIKNYAIRYNGGMPGSGNGVRAQIQLFGHDNKMVGWLDFYDDQYPLPTDRKNEAGKVVLSFNQSHIMGLVDILRNEGPVYLNWQESIKNGYISTSQELVGEGE